MDKNFGEFTNQLDEVLEFIRSDKLLSGGELPDNIDALLINDLNQILTDADYEAYGDERMV